MLDGESFHGGEIITKETERILDEAVEAAIRASDRLDEINRGIFLSHLTKEVPLKYRFLFEVFREQLMNETYDFEGLRLRLGLYSTLKKYRESTHEDVWKLCFKESFTEDEFWRYLKLGIGYVLDCIITSRRDIPVLASKFLPFCTTYNCKFRKGGCLFSIGEDIFTIIELLLNDSYLNASFQKKVLDEYEERIQEKLYNKCLEFLNRRKLLPPFLAASDFSGDSYVTIRVLNHLYKKDLYTDEKAMKDMVCKCVNAPQSQLYMPNPRAKSGKIIIDTSPVLKIKIAQLLVDLPLSDCETCSKFIEEQVSLAASLLKTKNLDLLMGPIWGRDRYSSVGWCSHSDIYSAITAMDFLLDIFNKRRNKDIVQSLKDGIEYLLNTKNPNYTWPVTTIEKFKRWSPTLTGNVWNSKGSKQIDEILEERPEIFNISFSNTVEAINVLLKASNLLKV